jgi:hypothetical protein
VKLLEGLGISGGSEAYSRVKNLGWIFLAGQTLLY